MLVGENRQFLFFFFFLVYVSCSCLAFSLFVCVIHISQYLVDVIFHFSANSHNKKYSVDLKFYNEIVPEVT